MREVRHLPDDPPVVAACFIEAFRSAAWLDTLTELQAKKYYKSIKEQRGRIVPATMEHIREYVALAAHVDRLLQRKAAVEAFLTELIGTELDKYARGVWVSLVKRKTDAEDDDMDL